MQSYDYAHRDGIAPMSWEEFATLSRKLAEGLARREPDIDLILGIARAGLFPATAVACALRRDLVPIRLTRREQDQVVRPSPLWKTPVPPEVAGKVVAVIDEIADTGQTLRLAAAEAGKLGARRVVTAALVAHSWAEPPPDVVALTSDALVLFPWDREVFADGRWQPHPELSAALMAQGFADERSSPERRSP